MEDSIKEKYISKSPEPVSLKGTENILDQMNNCVCRIFNKVKGTGFFTKIPFQSKLLPVLITNNHIINQNDIINNNIISIYLNNNKIEKIIELDNNRIRYTNEKLDITIIEIKENKDKLNNKYIELDDNIINYFKLNKNKEPNYLNNRYSSESIYVINYPEDKDIVVSYGQPPELNESEINHKCCTKPGSSGSPILLINNQKLIGIHYGINEHFKYNKGTLIIYSIIELQNIKNNLLIINKEGKYIDNNNEINNYIIAEFDIKKDNENILIINSYEHCKNENLIFGFTGKEYENENEIKENCEIKINDKIISFSYYYKFNEKGKYTIKYIFKKIIINLNFMFFNCRSLTNINLSNFNTNNVTNMSCMFCDCISLINIDLSNFNTNNVTNMNMVFSGCESLINIDLSNFNTNKVTDMSDMFSSCYSLKIINLSNFNTNNVTNMSNMFSKCKSLTNINLSNFNTKNVTKIKGMFFDCKKLNKIIVYDKKILKELNNNLFIIDQI